MTPLVGPKLLECFEAARAAQAKKWKPNPGPQAAFMACKAYEVLYGGAAGGGKSAAEIAMPLQWIDNPHFRALILRRETTQLEDLLDKADALYKQHGATFNGSTLTYTFPSGAEVRFGHCKDKNDWQKYQGHEFHLVAFDELTHFLARQYREIASRIRSAEPGLPRYLRATTNPGGDGHDWVFERWAPWLDPECVLENWVDEVTNEDGSGTTTVRGTGLPLRQDATGAPIPPAKPGQILYVVHTVNGPRFSSTKVTPSLTRTFIPARLSDNPKLTANDPEYRQKLRDNDSVRRAQLEDGNWLVKPAAGMYFRREWVTFVDEKDLPHRLRKVRFWDKAASEPSKTYPDPDWTVGVKMAQADGRYYILDVVRMRGGPGAVEQAIFNTAEMDGKDVAIRMAQDPGSAGKSEVAAFSRLLAGYSFNAKPESGDKETRFGAFSAQANPISTGGSVGRVCVVRGPWNKAYLEALEGFPEARHDDDADATSGAFGEVVNSIAAPILAPRPTANTYRLPGNVRGFG